MVDAIGSQARMVAEASDLAETQLREAEASLAARAADLAAAAAEASDAARVGAEDLSRQIARLETAGQGVGDQMGAVERTLATQRAALVAASQSLRTDQEDFAAESETRTAQLTEFIGHTRAGATEMSDMAAMGAEVLRGLIGAAAQQLREVAETARAEREALAAETSSAIAALASAAGGQRADLETALAQAMEAMAEAARKANEGVELRVEAARVRVDQLNEIAFAAGQKADTVFESRMDEARDLIEQSAQVVEQAGARTALKLSESVETARGTIAEMEAMLADVGRRTADLPAEALARANEVRAQIEQGIEDLRTLRPSDRRGDGGDRSGLPGTRPPQLRHAQRSRRPDGRRDARSRAVPLAAAAEPSGPAAPPAAPPAPPPGPQPANEPSAEEVGLRPRLRLTPTASDDEFRSVFDAAGGRNAAPAPPGERAEPQARRPVVAQPAVRPGKRLARRRRPGREDGRRDPGHGHRSHGPAARARIDEIAATIQTHDEGGAREVVKKLAPAAIRRLVRRLFSDAALRAEAERFLRRYAGMMDEASSRTERGFLVAALLSVPRLAAPTCLAGRRLRRSGLRVKRLFDAAASGAALLLLAVPLLIVAAVVRLTSPGPALYWSQRVGRGNALFSMPKFRTMRIDTPEVATHLLADPDRWLTPPGAFLRKTSIDELPQLWSVLVGRHEPGRAPPGAVQPGRPGGAADGGRGRGAAPRRHRLGPDQRPRRDRHPREGGPGRANIFDAEGFWFDLTILLRTVLPVVTGRGVTR